MSTFDSTKRSLADLLRDTVAGKIQLPDFQRGWVWDDEHIRDLLVSIARSFPIGAVMLLENGGSIKFQMRPVEGVVLGSKTIVPESLILDGQQRLTTLTQTLALQSPVATKTSKKKDIQRFYYFDIAQALASPDRLHDAVVAVNADRKILSNFDRDVSLDLSTTQLECETMHFPCNHVMDSDAWEEALQEHNPGAFSDFMQFRKNVIRPFRDYHVPVIELKKETSKEAVCLVFEKVNTGGVVLSVFELLTASYAAENYNLRDDWFGSTTRNVDSRKRRLSADHLLEDVSSTDFLQTVTLLQSLEKKNAEQNTEQEAKRLRPFAVSVQRADILDLPLESYKKWADTAEEGFLQAAYFLRNQSLFSRKEIPYSTQLIPLAAILAVLGQRWREPQILGKIAQWFWCASLGELYGGAVGTRMANDVDDVLAWIGDDGNLPRTIRDASFQPSRLDQLKSRTSAAYKAVNVLILRAGSLDFLAQMGVRELDAQDEPLDIHHIFPSAWCKKQDIHYNDYDTIVNKTTISARSNRIIGGHAPSAYVRGFLEKPEYGRNNSDIDSILLSHGICPEALRADDFHGFMAKRRAYLLTLIERAMGKAPASSDLLPEGADFAD